MARFGPQTIRAKLTLVTTIVMGGLLGAFGFSVDFAAHRAVLYSVDDSLLHRGRAFGDGPHRGMGPPGFGWHPPDDGPHPHFQGDFGPFGPHGEPHPGDGFGPPPGHDRDIRAERLEDAAHTDPVPPPQNFEIGRTNPGFVSNDIEAFSEARRIGRPVFSTIHRDGHAYRLLTMPYKESGKVTHIGELMSPLDGTEQTLAEVRQVLISIIIPVGMVISALASLFVVARLTRPLRVINQNAEAIGPQNAGERLPVVGRDEFAALAVTLNGMLHRLEEGLTFARTTNRQLEQTVVQQRRFTEDASHELKTPLAVIKANTGLLLHFGGSAEDVQDSVLRIDLAANRMNALVRDLLVLARTDAEMLPSFEATDLRDVIEDALGQLSADPERILFRAPDSVVTVNVSRDDLSRVFVNLIDNALRHSRSLCPVEVSVSCSGSWAKTVIKDRGTGISPEHLPRLFDRFYRVDSSRSSETGGTGLGLAICKGIVEAHGGTIEVTSVLGVGTTFTVDVPLAE